MAFEIWKKFFPVRVVKHWHRLPKGVVAAPSLEVLKARKVSPSMGKEAGTI